MPAPINSKLREEIIADYAVSNSVNAVRQKHGVSWATVRKIVEESETQINVLREQKQKKYINDAWEVVNVYLAKLMDPKTIKEAKARDCATVIIGMLERIQRQQELNQQYDVMYENINRENIAQLFAEMQHDEAMHKEMIRFVSERLAKSKDERKEVLKSKLKEKAAHHITENKKDSGRNREELESLFNEARDELLGELYIK